VKRMDKKYYTFLITPGAHGKLRRVQLPSYVVQLVLVLSGVGIITMAGLAQSYTRMLLKVSDYNGLRTEREVLRSHYHALEYVVHQSQSELESLQSIAAEVAMTYGFTEQRRPQLPSAAVVAATRFPEQPGTAYISSLYAFNILKTTRLVFPHDPISQNMFSDGFSTTPAIWPVQGRVTAGFGQRMDPFTGEGEYHTGIDIAAAPGTLVVATADGILFHAGPDAGYGTDIVLDHGYGITTMYCHLSKIYAVIGQEVKRGQVLGAVGMTGRATGPHLHYEVRIHDTSVNPARYLPGLQPTGYLLSKAIALPASTGDAVVSTP
jgi:murein DD-endopeptidase MepM/ murein hydrolase activator NlpD